MKGHLCVFLLVGAILLTGCSQQEVRVTRPSPEESRKIIEASEPAAVELMQTLKTELMQAMQEGGPANAIQICNTKALPLTDEIQKNSELPLKIKRTSFKYRNPQNAPDQFEKLALKIFEETAEQGQEIPGEYVQKIEQEGRTYYRYYKPLTVGGLCLSCHGQPENMDQQVLAVLQEKYPEDKATGYQAGDFRGFISVTLYSEE